METGRSLTEDQIQEAVKQGRTNKDIAQEFNVHPSQITRWRKKREGTAEREMAVSMLRAEGLDTKGIAAAVGVNSNSIYQIEDRMRKEGKNPLLLPKRIKSAVKFVDLLRAGEPFGTIEKVKDSTALAANQMILDRAYPKVSDNPVNSYSFTKIDLTIYQGNNPQSDD